MEIREASPNDAPAISQLLIYLSEKFISGTLTDEGKSNLVASMSPEAISSYIDRGYDYKVAEEAGKVVGVVATRDDSHLYHLFVHESLQGTGLARKLWELAKSDCVARSGTEIFTVNSSLNAQEVYKSWGFVPLGGVRETGGVKDIPMKLRVGS